MWRVALRKTAGPALLAATTTALAVTLAQRRAEDESETGAAPPTHQGLPWWPRMALSIGRVVQCEAPTNKDELDPSVAPTIDDMDDDDKEDDDVRHVSQGFNPRAKGDYHGLFPARQLWHPAVEYPLWDVNWDGKHPPSTGDDHADRHKLRQIRKHGVTRHIILVRHGQYDETHKEDEKRVLTELGRQQAALTGQRLAAWLDADVPLKHVRVSNMTRAKETAAIITTYLPDLVMESPDPLLNEGRPCHHIPGGRASAKTVSTTDDNHPRIEAAFQKYFHRADYDEEAEEGHHHEVEIIVCHANVIRYFLCRALQLPPETWLRFCPFNCSLTYFTIRPTGTVSCRMVGDIGHLSYDTTSFSMHEGFLW